MSAGVESIVMDVQLPGGVAGPDPLDFDVRCFLVSHASGVVLIDTLLPGSKDPIASALARIGATWHDITDVVLTHNHPDHIGGLAEVLARTDGAAVWVGAEDQPRVPFDGQLRRLVDGERVRDLRVLRTPGHTPGHSSFVHEIDSILFAGDAVGSIAGTLSRGPAAFTADTDLADQSLHRIASLECDRVMFSHGGEIPDPMRALRNLLGDTTHERSAPAG